MSEESWARVQEAHALLRKERELAFQRAVEARQRLVIAQDDYEVAVMEANALGVPNTRLARAFRISETAVRSFVKRHKG